MNLIILAGVWRFFRRVRRDGEFAHRESETLLNTGGVLARVFQPLLRLVTKDWHMLLLGFLFWLGFDTATEISLLGISLTQAGEGMSVWLIMVFPTLFAQDVTDRYHRRRANARSLQLGIHQPDAQALLQLRPYGRFCCRGGAHRRHPGVRLGWRSTRSGRQILG
jgi:High-affinity nickel-transport protein